MQLVFSCPECSSGAIINLDDEEVASIKKAIVEDGRSPTLLATCDDGHELLVTLYFRDDELGVRDVAVPLGTGKNGRKEETKPEKKLSGELDWVKDVFGG
ncbi:MAG: hypothetical protein ACXAEF_09050 [Candidatus Thorarchaeota archaeon]|jgi:hypothetical protein